MARGIQLQSMFQQHSKDIANSFIRRRATFAFISHFFPFSFLSKCCNYDEIIKIDVEISISAFLNEMFFLLLFIRRILHAIRIIFNGSETESNDKIAMHTHTHTQNARKLLFFFLRSVVPKKETISKKLKMLDRHDYKFCEKQNKKIAYIKPI